MTTDAAKSVENYLLYLRDPSSLIDEVAIKAAEDAVAKASESGDVLAEAKARAELESAKKVDASDFRSAFVGAVKKWADENKVSAKVLADMGVAADVLSDAGFDMTKIKTTTAKATRKASSGKRVSSDAVQDHVAGLAGTFTLKDVADATGASTQTVRTVVSSMVKRDKATEEGDDPNHSGRGRAPKVYKVK